jgi:hypothetical protein
MEIYFIVQSFTIVIQRNINICITKEVTLGAFDEEWGNKARKLG